MTAASSPRRPEDVFSGVLELTASERSYVQEALVEAYVRGGWCPKGENRRDFYHRVSAKFNALALTMMVTPDGARLVSPEEHAAIVAAEPGLAEAPPEPCSSCASLTRAGLEGSCPACANERARQARQARGVTR